MRRTTVVGAAMVVAAAVGLSWNVQAAGGPDSEDALIRRGLALRKHGKDQAALPLLERAYALAHSPRAAAQLGFAEQALGRWTEAEVHVSEALRADHDRWVTKNRVVVSQALDTIHAHVPPPLPPSSSPPTAPASSPPPAQMAVGAVPPAPLSRPVPVWTPPSPHAAPVQPLLVQQHSADPGHTRRVAGVSLAAGGVAAIGLGVASSLVSKGKVDAINADARADRPFNEANGNWKSYDRAAAVLYVVGASALVSGIVVYSTAPSPEQERAGATPPRSVALRPVMGVGRAGAALAVRF